MNTLSSTDGETRTLKRIALESKPSMFTNFITSALATPTPQAAPSTPIGEAWGGCGYQGKAQCLSGNKY